MATPRSVVDPTFFRDIQEKIDEETEFKDEIKDIVHILSRQVRSTQATLSRIHSITPEEVPQLVTAAEKDIASEIETIGHLSKKASEQAYYKWNFFWSRPVQDVCYTILLTHWLKDEKLLTIEEIGAAMKVPVNLKDRDAFHLTIEEYLLALISLVDELARLARNSVTVGDYNRPLQISQFVKDIHAGFQILNLKNDTLRKRSDGIKYRVKEVEDVVYDLSLRNLLPKDKAKSEDEEMK